MEKLYNTLVNLYTKELCKLNIGYPYDKERIGSMLDFMNVIDFVKYNELPLNQIYKIIEYYE